MAVPHFVDGEYDGVSAKFNAIAEEIDNLGICCLLSRVSPTAVLDPNVDLIVPWENADIDTRGGMWDPLDPAAMVIRVPGVYTLTLQERFGLSFVGSPYSDGQRAGRIMYKLPGTDYFNDTYCTDKKAASATGEGTTLSCSATVQIPAAGYRLYAIAWQGAGSWLEGMQTDFGGTYMSATRVGPVP